jgi:hypothetical protein
MFRLGPDLEKILTPDEEVIMSIQPAWLVWLLSQWHEVALAGLMLVIASKAHIPALWMLALAGITFQLLTFVRSALNVLFTRYVLTDYRAIRASGILRRDHEWMSWRKVTDVSVNRSLGDRLFGTATIVLHNANEESGFKELADVPDPVRFGGRIAELVHSTQRRSVVSSMPGEGEWPPADRRAPGTRRPEDDR